MTDQSTKRPWSISLESKYEVVQHQMQGYRGQYRIVRCNFSTQLARTASLQEAEANANLIVQAVNTYDKNQAVIRELKEACKAALEYDKAIQYQANKSKSWVQSNTLDDLYHDWVNKAKVALTHVKEIESPEDDIEQARRQVR